MVSKIVVILLFVSLSTLDLLHVTNAVEEVKPTSNLKNEDGADVIKIANGEIVPDDGHPAFSSDSNGLNSLGDHEGGSSLSASDEFEGFKLTSEKIIPSFDGEEDIIIIWKIEDGQVRPTDLKDYRAFKSDETYVVVHVRRNLTLRQKIEREAISVSVLNVNLGDEDLVKLSSIYYWIGENSTLTDTCAAASHAISIDETIHEIVDLHREPEGHESPSFKATFERDRTVNRPDASIPSVIDENVKMMFLIREDYVARFTQINSSLKRFVYEKDVCLVLNSAVVYTYCGYSTSTELKKLAMHVAKTLLTARGSQAKEVIIYRSEQKSSELSLEENQRLNQFFAEFTSISDAEEMFYHYLRLDEARGKPEVKEEDLPIIRFYVTDEQTVLEEQIDSKSTTISSFITDECYVIDVGSNIGFIIWVGSDSLSAVREASARRVEQLLREKEDRLTPILYADERNVNVPAAVYLSDLITLMKNVKLPLSWILRPDGEPTAEAVPEVTEDSESA